VGHSEQFLWKNWEDDPLRERRTPNAERRTPNAERRTLNAERRTPKSDEMNERLLSGLCRMQRSGRKWVFIRCEDRDSARQ